MLRKQIVLSPSHQAFGNHTSSSTRIIQIQYETAFTAIRHKATGEWIQSENPLGLTYNTFQMLSIWSSNIRWICSTILLGRCSHCVVFQYSLGLLHNISSTMFANTYNSPWTVVETVFRQIMRFCWFAVLFVHSLGIII